MENRTYRFLMSGGSNILFWSLLQNVQKGVVDQKASYLVGTGRLPWKKQTGREAKHSSLLQPKLSLIEAVPPIPHMLSWRIHVLLYFHLQ
jgi:hypothetical protein